MFPGRESRRSREDIPSDERPEDRRSEPAELNWTHFLIAIFCSDSVIFAYLRCISILGRKIKSKIAIQRRNIMIENTR